MQSKSLVEFAFILDILLMNSYGIEIYLSNYCSLLTLNCVKVLASSQNFRILVLKLTIKYIFRGFKETPSKLQKKAREKLKEKEFPGYFFCSSFHIIINYILKTELSVVSCSFLAM